MVVTLLRAGDSWHEMIIAGPVTQRATPQGRLGACAGVTTTRAAKSRMSVGTARLNGEFKLHKFRKSYATLQHRDGVDARTIQKRLGHSDLSTTLAYLEDEEPRSDRQPQASEWNIWCVRVTVGGLELLWLLQLRVLGYGLLQDRDVGIGVFPESESSRYSSPPHEVHEAGIGTDGIVFPVDLQATNSWRVFVIRFL